MTDSENEEIKANSEEEEDLVNQELENLKNDDSPSASPSPQAQQNMTGSQESIQSSKSKGSRNSVVGDSLASVRSQSVGSPMPQFLKERLKVLFVYPLEKKYECPSCDEVLRYPVLFEECGHRVCSHCFETEIKRSDNRRCPTDRGKIDVDSATIDKEFNKVILSLEVKCSNHEWGCKWEGEYQQIQEHLESCEYGDILCINDCGAKFQKRFLQKHLDKDCPKKIIACSYCDDRHLREDKKEHIQECPKIPLPCPNKCDKTLSISRDELDKHIEENCPKTKISCDYEGIGCEHRCSREKLPKHYKSDIINHVKLIQGLAMQNKERLDKHDASLVEHVNLIQGVDRRIGDLEKIAHNAMLWRVEDYTRKLKESKAGNLETLFSPTFTTSKHGYRLCASVCLNGDGKGKGTHMSIFVSLLKGAYDALLKWPFDYRVTFFLLDQNDDPNERKHIKFSIKPNPCAENEPFLGRPRMEKNASFGGAKFVRHDDVETRKYLKDDTVFIKVVVDCDGMSEP